MPTAIKPTEKGQEDRLERISHLKQTRDDLSSLEGLKKSPEGAKLISILRRYKQYAEREEKRWNIEHEGEELTADQFSRKVLRSRQKQADFQFIVDLLDKTTEQIELVEIEIKRVEKIYKDAKELID